MSVVWGASGAQIRDVLLKLGQGRAVSKGLLNLARVFIFGSHGHHLRAMNVSANAGIRRAGRGGRPEPLQ
jgi:hypothetical protein